MYFELLANELILDLFEYLDGTNLLYCFSGLNSRLNHLLLFHFRSYHFDFRSISRRKFETICRYSIPLIFDRIQSLSLSNDDETPHLPDFFFSFGLTFNQFTYLKSLSFYSIESCEQLNYFITQCHQLSYLVHLQIIESNLNNDKKELHRLMNNIWSLSKLEYLNLDENTFDKLRLKKINVISNSLRKISMENVRCSLDEFKHLIKQTPNIESIHLSIEFNFQDEHIRILKSKIKHLKLTFESSYPVLIKLFRMMPNLLSLKIKTSDLYFKGAQWEKILDKYLIYLKIFQFRMYFQFPLKKRLDEEFDELLTSYKTPFWIVKHQLYVACDCIPFHESFHGIIYTLPYNFDQFIRYNTIKSASTYPNPMFNWTFDKVRHVQYLNPTNDSNILPIEFRKIRHLKVGIPFDGYFLSLIPSLENLYSVEVILGDNFPYEQLQKLLELAPNVYSLKILCSLDFKICLNRLKSSSIRRLNFIPKCSSTKGFFNNDECSRLAYSQLAQQCQVLSIRLENRTNILDLLRTMIHLRSLNIQCFDDPMLQQNSSIADDQFLQWLASVLPPTYLISRDKHQYQLSTVKIWIDEQQRLTN
mgnify:CR=1 FL=1